MPQAKILTDSEIKQVITVTRTCSKYPLRDISMLLLTHLCGLRVGEVAKLKVEDVMGANKKMLDEISIDTRIQGSKKSHVRKETVPEYMQYKLKEYIDQVDSMPPHRYLFFTQKQSHFTRNTAAKHLNALYIRAGITGATSHSGRRTWIAGMVNNPLHVKIEKIRSEDNVEMNKNYNRNMSKKIRDSLYRRNKRVVGGRGPKVNLSQDDINIIESCTYEEFHLYMKYYKTRGTPGRKTHVMLDKIIKDGVTGNVLSLAKIRNDDKKRHNRIKQALFYRWTDNHTYHNEKNYTPEKFWRTMAKRIQKRKDFLKVDIRWQGEENTEILVKYLKSLYEAQDGKCALTGLQLEVKSNSLFVSSVDRINSRLGYTYGNIWLTCWWANQMKTNYSLDEFKEKIKILHDHLNL